MSTKDIQEEIEPTVEAFINVGFTKYESLVLAILTAHGTSTVKGIHQFTDVPLPKVYQTLESLVRKELIKQHSKTRPVQYTAYSPNIIMRKIEEKNRDLEGKLKSGLDHLSDLTTPSFVGDISPFSGESDFKRIVQGVLMNAKDEVSVAMSAKTLALFKDDFAVLKKREAKMRSMIFGQLTKVSSTMEPSDYHALGFDHYTIDLPVNLKPNLKFLNVLKKIGSAIDYLGIIISDTGEAVILLPLFPHEHYFGIWIHSKQIIERQLISYNELFKLAKKT
ncbi:MAG: TrmB family transcriptional regulator [Candidatus Heimdallarchaeota archaeon]